jgi:hypothetical protein
MARELEVFLCPECKGENRVGWAPGESKRTIPCVHCRRTVWPEAKVRKSKASIPIEVGCRFAAVKGSGVRKEMGD